MTNIILFYHQNTIKIFIIYCKGFFPLYSGRWCYYQVSYSWHTFLDQSCSRKSNHQTSLNIRYESFRFYNYIRSHKSNSIVKVKKLINTWMEHDVFASTGKIQLFLSFLQQVRNFNSKSQHLSNTFTDAGGQVKFCSTWLYYWLMMQKHAKNPSTILLIWDSGELVSAVGFGTGTSIRQAILHLSRTRLFCIPKEW